MWKNKKNILAVIGLLVLLWLCYQLAFKKTWDTYQQKKELESQAQFFRDMPKQLAVLKQKERYYDSLLKEYNLNRGSLQNNLLHTLNTYAEDYQISIIEFKDPHIFNDEKEIMTYTYQFKLQGEYNDLIQLVYQLEQGSKYGELVHVSFLKKKNYRTQKNELTAQVLLQNFEEKL